MSLDQDNVLGDSELSPSAFDEHEEEHANESKGKSKSKLPMIGGIAIAVVMVLFFIWKLFIAPYMGSHEEPAGIQPIPANNQGQQQVAQPSSLPQGQPMGGQATPQMTQEHPTSAPLADATPQPAQANTTTPAAQAGGVPQQGVNSQATAQAQPQPQAQATQPQQAVPPAEQQTAPAQRVVATQGDELAKVNARIDGIEKNIASLHEEIARLAAGAGTRHAEKPTPTAKKASAKPSVKPKKAEEKAAPAKKDEARESKQPVAKGDLHLKAVLDGRAWFQTKNGESITVSPGEEVRGVGTVKSIDAERGQVVFTNGAVVR